MKYPRLTKTVSIELAAMPGESWEQAFQKNIDALEWAIERAPAAHTAALIDTKLIILKLKSELMPIDNYEPPPPGCQDVGEPIEDDV